VPVGDWFYDTGFSYDPGMVIRYLLECVSRDGAAAICIASSPMDHWILAVSPSSKPLAIG